MGYPQNNNIPKKKPPQKSNTQPDVAPCDKKQAKGQGKVNLLDQNQGRNYNKPWLMNAKNDQPDSKKMTQLDSVGGSKIVDAHLIDSLEKEIIDSNLNVKFDDIAGCVDAKIALEEACIQPQLQPELFDSDLRQPWSGILLYGPPGTGKTMLAKAVASMTTCTFFKVGASSLGSKWRGESEKLVKTLFEMARFQAPSVVFLDEIDSLAGERGDSTNECSRRVLNELLTQVDGLTTKSDAETEKKTVMFLAATNHPWHLDSAMIRRLEKRIYVPLPNEAGRKNLFEIILKKEVVGTDLS